MSAFRWATLALVIISASVLAGLTLGCAGSRVLPWLACLDKADVDRLADELIRRARERDTETPEHRAERLANNARIEHHRKLRYEFESWLRAAPGNYIGNACMRSDREVGLMFGAWLAGHGL